jgi:ATP/maltotriose-dependent transcriptional regulator MalT
MTNLATLRRGRKAFEQRAWSDSYRCLSAADGDGALEPEDLERLATAAYLLGRDDESEACRARAHQAFVRRGDHEAAARSAGWLAFGLLQRGAVAPASGWLARAARILDDAQLDCVVRGYLLIPSAVQFVVHGDAAAGHAAFSQAADIASRFDDPDLASLARHGRGRALIHLGQVAEGIALLDEAMAGVIAGEVAPILAGDIYCSVLEACQETFDLRRAYEWTTSLAQWCASQPDLVRYRGECLLYRAEVMQLRGNWDRAAQDAHDACGLLTSGEGRPMAGAAFYRLGEIHRLRGDFPSAEAAYARANERGRKPYPGLSLLRLAQGHVESAAASIRGVLVDTRPPADRARVLTAAIEILLAASDLDNARAATGELTEIASRLGASLLRAASAHATGALLLAQGDMAAASTSLREAWEIWRDLEMPYEEAQTCVLIAAVCEKRGDEDGRRLELETARRLFTQLAAAPWLTRMTAQSARASSPRRIGSLSEREAQVLRLLAAGKTNRAIADALFISEKTVARHVSNIFDKLGVSSRTGATAWAFQHDVL